ncbi:MAG: polysaccharide deacetylase family protein, partial [Clostridium perfringens]|nr:polysaccharide deacetylase family protein [Clostridium perfringens]
MKKIMKMGLILSVLICLGSFVGCNSLNKKQVEATENKEAVEAKDTTDEKNTEGKDKAKTNELEYLPFDKDPNAEDGKVVSEYTNGLLKGTLQYPVRKDGKKIAYLTFDDGPSTTNTPEVLKILDKYNIKGTFFVTGNSISAGDKSKELLKQIVKNGHAIGNHTYSHDYKYLYPNRKMNVNNIMSDINKNENLMKEGKDKDTPVALISWATRYNQRVVTSTLENVYETAIKEEVKPPTLIVVGSVVGLREKLNFFESKPLFGKSIAVTRSRNQNSV